MTASVGKILDLELKRPGFGALALPVPLSSSVFASLKGGHPYRIELTLSVVIELKGL